MNARLTQMRAYGLEVNLGTLLLGLTGPAVFGRQIDLSDVDAIAVERLVAEPDAADAVDVLVAVASGLDETRAALRKHRTAGVAAEELELRKWRLVLLVDEMRRLPSGPVDGLMELTSFWARFDYPADAPHVVQGHENTVSPADYFTDENYRATLARHAGWIQREILTLSEQDREFVHDDRR